MGAMLAQYSPVDRKEKAIYYLSKKMLEYEEKYSALEKSCLSMPKASALFIG